MAATFFTFIVTQFSQFLLFFVEIPFLDWRCPKGC